MKAADYLASLPFAQRADARRALARAHGRPLSSIYKWLARGSHPADRASMAITEEWSDYAVTRFDERPDVWCIDETVGCLERLGYRVHAPEDVALAPPLRHSLGK